MFSKDFDNSFEEIFENNQYPKLKRLSHVNNNATWTHNYHIHKDSTEIVYIVDGKAHFTIDMESFSLEKGNILILEKGVLHSIKSDKENPVDSWTCLISDYKLNGLNEQNKLLYSSNFKILDMKEHTTFITSLIKELYSLSLNKTAYSDSICNLLSASLLAFIFSLLPPEPIINKKGKASFVKDILIYIGEHYTEHITISKLSKVFHMSPSYISHMFSKEFGISPINYAIDLRLCEAKWLLINTNDSLTSISEKIGYENTAHFSNMFEKRIGYSPLEYRNLFSEFKKSY